MFHSMTPGTIRPGLRLAVLFACLALPLQLRAQLQGQSQDRSGIDMLSADVVNETLGLSASDMYSLHVTGQPGSAIKATIVLEGSEFTLDLAPHSNRSASHYKLMVQGADGLLTEPTPAPVRTLRGTVVEIPGSKVAASYDESGGLYARIRVVGEPSDYWVEQVARSVPGAAPDVHVTYRGSNVVATGSKCGVKALPVPDGGTIALGSGCGTGLCVAELGCDSDVEYYQDQGSSVTNVENRINSIINAMNLQYEDDVGLRHDITAIVVRTSEPDPYSSNDISNLLSQLRGQWLGPMSSTPHDVAQLFTGRNISGGTIGLAWLGSVCNTQSYSVVENFTNNFGCLTDLSAHELGHNWGAGHCSCNNWTMNPFITCANRFTAGSIASITGTKNSVGCLTPAGPPAADFHVFQTSGNAPFLANFTNDSSGEVTSWSWDFGDGGTSTQASPNHTYTVPGVYTVSLTATGPLGTDSLVMQDFIDVAPPLVPFADLGGGSPGAIFGVPELSVDSSLVAGSSLTVTLFRAPPQVLTSAWVAFASTPVAAFNGMIFPYPPSQQLFFNTNLFGAVDLSTTWPSGIPAGLDIYLQFLVQDATVPDGVTLSNAVLGTTP
jgi:PKD repeat protein